MNLNNDRIQILFKKTQRFPKLSIVRVIKQASTDLRLALLANSSKHLKIKTIRINQSLHSLSQHNFDIRYNKDITEKKNFRPIFDEHRF